MFHQIEAVLFDLDGTLIDSAPDLGAAADKMRTDRGMASLPLADYRPMAGAGARGGATSAAAEARSCRGAVPSTTPQRTNTMVLAKYSIASQTARTAWGLAKEGHAYPESSSAAVSVASTPFPLKLFSLTMKVMYAKHTVMVI